MLFLSAPLQGFTEAPWRNIHASLFPGSVDAYFTPFLRWEKGQVRQRDFRDLTGPLNNGLPIVAQIIARDAAEFAAIADAVADAGIDRIDLNAGCPYPMHTRHGSGAALVENPAALHGIADEMLARPAIRFSMKMRLGLENPGAWKDAMPEIARMPLECLTVHPRVARQLYRGQLHTDQFRLLANESTHPVIFNGDIVLPSQAASLQLEFTDIAGIMAGRGLLLRPTLMEELRTGREATPDAIREASLEIHRRLFLHFEDTLCGPSQILSKIKPFLEYMPAELFDRKTLKSMRKTSSINSYRLLLGSL